MKLAIFITPKDRKQLYDLQLGKLKELRTKHETLSRLSREWRWLDYTFSRALRLEAESVLTEIERMEKAMNRSEVAA